MMSSTHVPLSLSRAALTVLCLFSLCACSPSSGKYQVHRQADGKIVRIDTRTGEMAILEGLQLKPVDDCAKVNVMLSRWKSSLKREPRFPSFGVPGISEDFRGRAQLKTSWIAPSKRCASETSVGQMYFELTLSGRGRDLYPKSLQELRSGSLRFSISFYGADGGRLAFTQTSKSQCALFDAAFANLELLMGKRRGKGSASEESLRLGTRASFVVDMTLSEYRQIDDWNLTLYSQEELSNEELDWQCRIIEASAYR